MQSQHRGRARFWTGFILYLAGLAAASGAQPATQIATVKNNRTNTAAAVGGQALIPSGSRGKPRFPIIPAGVPIKVAGAAPTNQQVAMGTKGVVSGQAKAGVNGAGPNLAASGNQSTSKTAPVVPLSSAATVKAATSSASSQAAAAGAAAASAAPPAQQ